MDGLFHAFFATPSGGTDDHEIDGNEQTCDCVDGTGVAGVYVNSRGFLHDIVTLSAVQNVILQDPPETANRWGLIVQADVL